MEGSLLSKETVGKMSQAYFGTDLVGCMYILDLME